MGKQAHLAGVLRIMTTIELVTWIVDTASPLEAYHLGWHRGARAAREPSCVDPWQVSPRYDEETARKCETARTGRTP